MTRPAVPLLIAPDADNQPTLWDNTRSDRPMPLARQFETHPVIWALLVDAAQDQREADQQRREAAMTCPGVVPDEAVEAAIRAWLAQPVNAARDDCMRAALTAAAPFIRARALLEAADGIVRGAGLIAPPRSGGMHPATQWLRDRAAAEREGGADRG